MCMCIYALMLYNQTTIIMNHVLAIQRRTMIELEYDKTSYMNRSAVKARYSGTL